jgi:hypothetical protein
MSVITVAMRFTFAKYFESLAPCLSGMEQHNTLSYGT